MSANAAKHRNKMASRAAPGRVVLVGTYKGDQLAKWRGWYNYPISDKDKIAVADAAIETATNGVDSLGAATYDGRDRARPSLMQIKSFNCRSNKITELWLFKGAKDERRYKAEFVGVKTRKELIDDYGYPAKGKSHGNKYLLFKTDFKYQHKGDIPEDAERVIIRTADFATAPKVRKQLKAYLESSDRKDPDLAKRLPEIIVKLRPDQSRACESTVQIELFSWDKLQPVHLPKQGEFTAEELFAGAGGLSIGLERAGIHVAIANEIMPDFAATLAANHPEANMANEDTCRFKEVA